MSEEESFLARWSRRKRDASEERAGEPPVALPRDEKEASPKPEPTSGEQPNRQTGDAPGQPLVDLSKLPPIESITAETDIRAFLAPGVPAELTRAALRRAWSADTSIRDFIGLVENDWDVLAPAAAAGVQPLTITDDMRRMVDALFSQDEADDAIAAASSGTARTATADGKSEEEIDAAASGQSIAALQEFESAPAGVGTPRSSHTGKDSETFRDPPPAALPCDQPASAPQQIDSAPQKRGEESGSSGVTGRRLHGRALPI